MVASNEEYPVSFLSQIYALLDSALKIDAASCATIQVYNRQSDTLEILAHRGFGEDFIREFRSVKTNGASVCARAFRMGNGIDIPDISLDAFFIPRLATSPAICFVAMQATPVLDKDGVVIGILSTYFSRIHRLSSEAKIALHGFASQVAALIERHVSEIKPNYQ